MEEQEQSLHTRVDGVLSDRPWGSTAASNEGNQMNRPRDLVDADNAELARENRLLRGERQALATRLRGIAESLGTHEPRRYCVDSILRLIRELETPAAFSVDSSREPSA